MNKSKHFPALDGLRGFATILVVMYHYLAAHYSFLSFGWSGIELFFVLSGFLISLRLLPYIDQQGALKKFYWNRFIRIVPLYFTFLIIFFSCWFIFTSAISGASMPFYKRHFWQFFLFIQNWVYIFDFSQATNHLQHLWSLAVEEQIYLVYPLYALLLVKKKYILPATIAFILIIAGIRTVYYFETAQTVDYKLIYWNTFFRADSFLCGVMTYLVFISNNERLKKIAAVVSITAIIALITGLIITHDLDKSNPFFTTIGRTLLAVSFSFIMWQCIVQPQQLVSRFFSLNIFKFIGKISYGIFIFHWPVFLTGFAVVSKLASKLGYHLTDYSIFLINVILSIVITSIISILSFRYYESYFLKWKRNYSSKKMQVSTIK